MIDLRDEEKKMKSIRGRTFIIAVLFSALLIMSSGAHASSLFAFDGNSASTERQIGLFQQAFQWLSGTWTDLTSVFELSEETPAPPPVPECTTNCGDAGPGIDPIG
jgi:hypothetical protein